MMADLELLMDELAEEARPVRPQSTRLGRWTLAAVAAASIAGVYAIYGFRDDVMRMMPSPLLGLVIGLMLLLSIAAGASVVRMARPQVGAPSSGAFWALAALLLLPATVLVAIVAQPALVADLDPDSGLRCLALGVAAGFASLVFLAVWLRQGAPVAPVRAAWAAGLASGAIDALAVTLECPKDALAHLGVWHVAVVLAAAGAARLVLPRFLRW